MVSCPTTRLLSAVPNVAASIGSFNRIQKFLLAESRIDMRKSVPEDMDLALTNGVPKPTREQSSDPTAASGREDSMMIRIERANIRPASDAEIVLSEVNLTIRGGSTAMITGPVGAGKTTLLKAILGEISCESGNIYTKTTRIGYCSQTPWLQSGTIREAVCGHDGKISDDTWLETVVDACALTYDLANCPLGDMTLIGSRGVTLSGGQKHRVALARALYSRCKFFILDDIFSALDKTTEKIVAEKLFGKGGLFQRLDSTVIMVTHSSAKHSLSCSNLGPCLTFFS
jgi:ABC-type multidrug transport system fused ATPase/permease subunit